ncbi:MAG TPA: hypothetical protein GX704_07275 [Clostridiales bacterium]|jgi:hypothetical protein|nr:hypothetical protein [Clostridiales bacterium]
MADYDLIILGASASALPLAARFGARCLAADEGISPGAEFVDALRADVCPTAGLSGFAADFGKRLFRRGIMTDEGRIHIGAAGGELAAAFLESGCQLLTSVSVTETGRDGEDFFVEMHAGDSGYMKFTASAVVDTRIHDFMEYEKSCAASVRGDLKEGIYPGFELIRGAFDKEFVMRAPVGREDSLFEAHKRLLELFSDPIFKGAKICWLAAGFSYRLLKPYDGYKDEVGIIYIPSAGQPSLLEAIDAGVKLNV